MLNNELNDERVPLVQPVAAVNDQTSITTLIRAVRTSDPHILARIGAVARIIENLDKLKPNDLALQGAQRAFEANLKNNPEKTIQEFLNDDGVVGLITDLKKQHQSFCSGTVALFWNAPRGIDPNLGYKILLLTSMFFLPVFTFFLGIDVATASDCKSDPAVTCNNYAMTELTGVLFGSLIAFGFLVLALTDLDIKRLNSRNERATFSENTKLVDEVIKLHTQHRRDISVPTIAVIQ